MNKTITFLLLACAASTTLLAQKTQFGIEAGAVSSDYFGKDGGQTRYTISKWGARAGFGLDGQVFKHIYLQPAFLFVMNGYKQNSAKGDVDYSINTLEVPFNVVYKLGQNDESRAFMGIGPYLALNLFGSKQYSNAPAPDPSGQINVGTDQRDDIRPFDVGLNIFAGNHFKKGLVVKVFYQVGFSNMSVPGGDDNVLKNKNSGVVIGYFFKNSKEKLRRLKMNPYNGNGMGM